MSTSLLYAVQQTCPRMYGEAHGQVQVCKSRQVQEQALVYEVGQTWEYEMRKVWEHKTGHVRLHKKLKVHAKR
jgi:hypothetical protein